MAAHRGEDWPGTVAAGHDGGAAERWRGQTGEIFVPLDAALAAKKYCSRRQTRSTIQRSKRWLREVAQRDGLTGEDGDASGAESADANRRSGYFADQI